MADGAKHPKRDRRWQRRIAVVAFCLFPMSVLAGLLAPGVVGLQLTGETDAGAPGQNPPLDFSGASLGHSPLLVPRDFSAGFIPELLDLDQLFLDTEFRVDPSGDRLAHLLAFPRSHGDAIVLDDVDGYPLDLLFDDALLADEIPAVTDGLTDAFGLGPIATSVPLGNRVRFDDFPGADAGNTSGGVIPEPGTGALLALGIGALALGRRRERA